MLLGEVELTDLFLFGRHVCSWVWTRESRIGYANECVEA